MLEYDQVVVSVLFLLEEKNLTVFCVTHFNVKMIFKVPTKVQIKLSEGFFYVTSRGSLSDKALKKHVSQKRNNKTSKNVT